MRGGQIGRMGLHDATTTDVTGRMGKREEADILGFWDRGFLERDGRVKGRVRDGDRSERLLVGNTEVKN